MIFETTAGKSSLFLLPEGTLKMIRQHSFRKAHIEEMPLFVVKDIFHSLHASVFDSGHRCVIISLLLSDISAMT